MRVILLSSFIAMQWRWRDVICATRSRHGDLCVSFTRLTWNVFQLRVSRHEVYGARPANSGTAIRQFRTLSLSNSRPRDRPALSDGHVTARCARCMEWWLWDSVTIIAHIGHFSVSRAASRSTVEVHRLSANNRYRPIIGRLFVLASNTTKMLLTAVHIDDNEVTNDSVISHVSSSTFNGTAAGVLPIYDRTIVTSQSLQYDFYWTRCVLK